MIACVDSDAENIFITLTARELRADILIIARASAEDSEKKLLRAGADRVISPYKTSGSEMARVALHPQVGGALDVADYRMEEIEVTPACEGVGKTIADVRGQSMIVAVRRPDGRLEPQPPPHSVIGPGDKLVALGTPAAMEHLERVFQPARHRPPDVDRAQPDRAAARTPRRRARRGGRGARQRGRAGGGAEARAAQARRPGGLLDQRRDAAGPGARLARRARSPSCWPPNWPSASGAISRAPRSPGPVS